MGAKEANKYVRNQENSSHGKCRKVTGKGEP